MAWEDDPNPEYDEEDDNEEEESDHEDEQSASSSPEPIASSLNTAIKDAPISEVREILTYICEHNDFARKFADGRLLTSISGNVDSGIGRKRKRFETCQNCKVEFNITKNGKGDCVYHPGQRELNDDDGFWGDHNPDIYGNPEDLSEASTYEEGFKWTCCGKAGGGEGCVETKHRATVDEIPEAKQMRFGYAGELVKSR